MPKKLNKQRRQNKQRNTSGGVRNKSSKGSSQPPVILRNLPVMRNPILNIQRATTRTVLATYGAIDGYAASDMEFTYAVNGTNYRIGGTSIYTDNLPNSSEFSALFDEYRINNIVMRIDVPPAWDNSGPLPIFLPNVYFISDYNDGNAVYITDILQYAQVQFHSFYTNGYAPLMVTMSPKPLVDIAGSGVATTYSIPDKVPWLRTADFTTPHYGFKMVLQFPSASQIYTIPMTFTIWYDMSFRNPR
jgi:hypothetical protein